MKIKLTVALLSLAACFAQDQNRKIIFTHVVEGASAPQVKPRSMKPRPNDSGIPVSASTLPQIPGAVIQVLGGVNGDPNRIATLIVKNPNPAGIYFISLVDGDGNAAGSPSGYAFPGYPEGYAGEIIIQNGDLYNVLPGWANIIYSVEVVYENGGSFEGLDAVIAGSAPTNQSGPSFQIQQVSIVNGQLSLKLTGSLSPNATVSIGVSGAFAVFTPDNNGGGTATLSQNDTNNIEFGPTSITICDKVVCGTSVFMNAPTQAVPINGGKG